MLTDPADNNSWRTDITGTDPKNRTVLIDATITCLTNKTNHNDHVADSRSRATAGLLNAKKKKSRDAHIQSVVQAHDTIFIPFAMSPNGALGHQAAAFLNTVFNHVKRPGTFSMRSNQQDNNSIWNTTWFSTYWRQRLSTTATATNAAFVRRIPQADSIAQQNGPKQTRASYFPKFYNYKAQRASSGVPTRFF